MAFTKKQACRKKQYQKVSFDLKLSIIDQIHNGLISVNHASEVYNTFRRSVTWMKKIECLYANKKGMNRDNKIKK
jgi:hypothetical protein